VLYYKGNPKHKEPWQPGRKGSLCPSREKLPGLNPQTLLETSVCCGTVRYAVYEGWPFEGRAEDQDGKIWHGYPVEWNEVPPPVKSDWLRDKTIKHRDLENTWSDLERRK